MSERNSTPLPISGSASNNDDTVNGNLTDDLDLAFDGAEDILRAWRRGMRPDADLTVSEWADAHRKLSSRASAEPGQYRTARTPYLREIMDALSPRHAAQRISFMKAAQVGATEAGNNWVGFVIHHAPGPMLAVLPTVEMAKRTSRGRIDPLIEDSPALKERVQPARSRDARVILALEGQRVFGSYVHAPAERFAPLLENVGFLAAIADHGLTLTALSVATHIHVMKAVKVTEPVDKSSDPVGGLQKTSERSSVLSHSLFTAECRRIVNTASTIRAANMRSVLARPLAKSIRYPNPFEAPTHSPIIAPIGA